MLSPDLPASAREVFDGVPRETLEKLALYEAELRRWQRITNLVGPRTLDATWSRHFADALQLRPLADGPVWVDLGSGAGFPGLVLAIADPTLAMHLVESDSRRCAFLRHVSRVTDTPVAVIDSRIETATAQLPPNVDVVTARAVASLADLLTLSERLLMAGATGLFPKGRDYEAELTRASESMRFTADIIPSRVDPSGRIVRIRDYHGRQTDPPSARER